MPKFKCMFDAAEDLELLLLGLPYKCSMVFRRHFFELLKYIHTNEGFLADLVLYTRARPNYAQQVQLGIADFYDFKYENNNSDYSFDSLFKMVISTRTASTAKTIETLAHNLNLTRYENIIILDDGGNDCWCRYDIVKLRACYNVRVIMMQCTPFSIWETVYDQNRPCSSKQKFYSVIKKERDKDKELAIFHEYLELLHQNKSTRNVTYFCGDKSTWKLW